MGESGFSGFLAPSSRKTWSEDIASKINFEEKTGAKTQDVKEDSTRHSSHKTDNKTNESKPQLMRQEVGPDATKEPTVQYMHVEVPQALDDEDHVYTKRTVRHKSKSKEGKLINFMRKYAVDQHDIDCVIHCRYGEHERHTWKHCLRKCIKKDDKRKSFLNMLPEEDHDAKALDYEVPPEFQEDLKRIKAQYEKLKRHGEL